MSAPTSGSVDLRPVVHAEVDIAAPPARVFEALVDSNELARWWGGDDSYRTHAWEIDARPGGRWRARTVDADGAEGTIEGEVRTLDAPRVLEYTWRASWDDASGEPSVVRYELTPAIVRGRSGTRLVVRHTGAAVVNVQALATCAARTPSRWLLAA